jgi:Zn-dependent peptidase ImmA (M78 family)/transcriptional regulator with XRE-family HTH domain
MIARATAVNPRVLRWARDRAGLPLEVVAARLDKTAEVISAWESGADAPTYRQLEELAERLYKRPVAVFFFPAPPDEEDPRKQFRTLPDSELALLAPDTLYAIREAVALRESVRELRTSEFEPSRLITRDIHPSFAELAQEVARSVRSYIGITVEDQSSWQGPEHAFKQWRSALESLGISVFKRSFKQREILGLSIFDDEIPVILINNSTAHARQVFTLIHELGHILYSIGGITKNESNFIDQLTGVDRKIEVTCNEFAAEFLVPVETFPWHGIPNASLDPFVKTQARRYNVSREVILRRLLDRGYVNERMYAQKVTEWNREYEESRDASGGGNYYATQAAYLGKTFLELAFNQYYRRAVTLDELASHLRVKARNISRLEDFIMARE